MMNPEVKQLFKDKRTSALRLAREMGITHTYMYELLSAKRANPERRKEIARRLRVRQADLARVCGWTTPTNGGVSHA
jgi:hypothetical protein